MNISGSNFPAGNYNVFFDGRTIGSIDRGSVPISVVQELYSPPVGSRTEDSLCRWDATATFTVESGVVLTRHQRPSGVPRSTVTR